MALHDLDSSDGIQQVSITSINSGSGELATFSVFSSAVSIANNKSMLSILNASGSGVVIKLREAKIVNAQNTAVTGIIAQFNLLRMTGHSAGTTITPLAMDSLDSINGSVTVRTGGTITGESANIINSIKYSSDEWGVGAQDVESLDHIMQVFGNLIEQKPGCKPLTLREGEGLTIKQVTNSSVGSFDLILVFTQEAA